MPDVKYYLGTLKRVPLNVEIYDFTMEIASTGVAIFPVVAKFLIILVFESLSQM